MGGMNRHEPKLESQRGTISINFGDGERMRLNGRQTSANATLLRSGPWIYHAFLNQSFKDWQHHVIMVEVAC